MIRAGNRQRLLPLLLKPADGRSKINVLRPEHWFEGAISGKLHQREGPVRARFPTRNGNGCEAGHDRAALIGVEDATNDSIAAKADNNAQAKRQYMLDRHGSDL
jgi:hypothetical protein